MKKTLALILSVLMVVSVAAFGSFSVAAEATTLIALDADWSYFVALGEETLPEGWYESGFDTSDWEVSAAPFTGTAYANDNANTQIDAQDQDLKTGFVTTFTVEDVAAISNLALYMIYDQDPVVYINGTQVYTTGGWNDPANEGSYLRGDFDPAVALAAMKNGENTIAVYMHNPVGGGGYHFALALEDLGTPDAVDADGNVVAKKVDKTGFADFGGVNAATNILDGNVVSCSGSGRNQDTEQSWTVSFWAEVVVSEIYLQCKGTEDGVATSHEDGVTFGYYNVYVGDTLVAENAPAVSESDGGYTITLDTPVTASSVKVELTGEWYASNWANLADIAIKGEVAEDTPVDPTPTPDPDPKPDPDPDPEPGDGGDQTGDAAVYATIAIAIAAVALAVVYKKRSTI